MSDDAPNKTVKMLPHYMCMIIDTTESGQSCSPVNSSICVQCPIRSRYISAEEGINDFSFAGHNSCVILWVVCVLVGVMGIFGNILIIAVLNKRRNSNKGFDFLLKVLASFDLLCCVVCIIASSCHVSYYGNWTGRGVVVLSFSFYSWLAVQFCRSTSQYITVLLTVERLLVITFPLRSRLWFSVITSRIMAACAALFAVLLSTPRFTSSRPEENEYRYDKLDIPNLRDLDYYLRSTKMTHLWYHTLKSAHDQVDFWGPLPILLVFNFLSYLQVRKLSMKRKELRISQKRDIQAVKMFLPVVIVLIVLNLVPISLYIMIRFYKVIYREIFFATILSITLNSAVNFIIFYLRAGQFRSEAHALLPSSITRMLTSCTSDDTHIWCIRMSRKSDSATVSSSDMGNNQISP